MGLLSLFRARSSVSGAEPLPTRSKDWFRSALRRQGWQIGETWRPLLQMEAQRPGLPHLFIAWEFGPLHELLLDTLNVTGGVDNQAVVIFTLVHPPDYLLQAAAARNVLLMRYDQIPRLVEKVGEMKAMLREERRRAKEANQALPTGPSEADVES